MDRELLFVELRSRITFAIPSWKYVRENGGLKNIITSLGFNYDDCYNREAVLESEYIKPFEKCDPQRMEATLFFWQRRKENKRKFKQTRKLG